MKIFLSFLQGKPDHPIPAYGFWEYYIKKGIEEAGHSWVENNEIDWALGLVPLEKDALAYWKEKTWQQTLDFLKKEKVDLFLSYLYPKQVDVIAINEIKKLGIPCVNFFCDNVRLFSSAPDEFGCFDLNWVPEYKALEMYKKKKFPYLRLPMPMWVAPEDREIKNESIEQVTFIGSIDIQRQLLFEEVVNIAPDLDLAVYGFGWLDNKELNSRPHNPSYGFYDKLKFQVDFIKGQGIKAYKRKLDQRKLKPEITPKLRTHLKGKPSFAEYINLTKESFITLGVNRYPDFRYPLISPNKYSRLRDLEAPMLGCCYLTEMAPGLQTFFEAEKEVFFYNNALELTEQCKKLLADKAIRQKARVKAQERALAEYSIPASLNKIKTELSIA